MLQKLQYIRCCYGYLSAVRCKQFAYCPPDATATPSSHVSLKSIMVYLSGAGLPRFSWKKRPLNGFSMVYIIHYTIGILHSSLIHLDQSSIHLGHSLHICYYLSVNLNFTLIIINHLLTWFLHIN